jgi:hypothetical protein
MKPVGEPYAENAHRFWKHFPFNRDGYDSTGVIKHILLHSDTASEYQRAIELEKDDPWLRMELGDELLKQGKTEEALKSFRAGLAIADRLARFRHQIEELAR